MLLKKLAVVTVLLSGIAVLSIHTAPAADEEVSGDEQLLKDEKVGTESADLLALLRNRTVDSSTREKIEKAIADLGSDQFIVRAQASQKLTSMGLAALGQLKKAAESKDVEVKTRAEACIQAIGGGAGTALPAAAVRVLVQRKAAEAVPVLLDFYSSAGDSALEETVLNGLAALGVRDGKVDPVLEKALDDAAPGRRAAAACALGRAGGVGQRAAVRRLLIDKDADVRQHAAHGLLGNRWPRRDDPAAIAEDEGILTKAKLGTDAAALIAFFRKRTLRDADVQQIADLIKNLAADRFVQREEATRKLIEFGPGALTQLRAAAKDNDLEMIRRAEICIDTITTSPGPALPAAALRLLPRRSSPEALAVVLDYLPFRDDARVEDEALTALSVLAVRDAAIDPLVTAALKDKHPIRRGAAALVLGRVGEPEQCAAVRELLKDPDERVRLRAAHGLLTARDKSAVDALIALLTGTDVETAAQAETLLQTLAGMNAPPASLGDNLPETRRKCQEGWVAWWRDVGSKEELPSLEGGGRQLGYTLVAELIGNNANGNRVWEFGLDGKARWSLTNLQGPIDAHMLPNGRVLVAEHNAQLVTERSTDGKTHWQFKAPGNPVAVQRLANGNTFIATYNAVMEVNPKSEIVYQHNPNPAIGGVIYDAVKLPTGNIVCIGGRGTVMEIDSMGKKVLALQVGANGGWGGVTPLPGGRFLVAMMNPGQVMEIDRKEQVHWKVAVKDACHAVRLPNGNTLVACMNVQKVVEVNRQGTTVWEKATTGRPFHVRRR